LTTDRSRIRNRDPNYRWVVGWDDQEIFEEIGGEMKKITVLAGKEYCVSWEGVEQLVKTLEKWWPGIKLNIAPVVRENCTLRESV